MTFTAMFADTSNWLSRGSLVAFPVAAAAGFISTVINPCALPLYPAATHACYGVGASEEKQPSFLKAAAFTFGMALSIAALGLAASAAGHIISIGRTGRYVIAALPLLMGMYKFGWITIPVSGWKIKWPGSLSSRLGGALAAGFLMSLVVGPCSTPVLASVLAYAAYRKAFLYSGLLLFTYGAGAGLPLIIFGTMVAKFTRTIERKGHGKWIDFAIGGALLLLGFYLMAQA